jgi:demethylphylloquinol methyltransferase
LFCGAASLRCKTISDKVYYFSLNSKHKSLKPVEIMSPSPSVQGIFNQIAPVYDRLNDWLSLGQHRIWKQMTVDWSGAEAGSDCLDLCCGSGDLTHLLARRVGPTGSVIGLDFAEAPLAIAQQKVQEMDDGLQPALGDRIQWRVGDALSLPFEDNCFDAITMGYGLRNVGDIPRCLQEIQRVLRPGKRAAILDFCHSDFPPVQWFQSFYFRQIVVPTARRFGCEAEYAYIEESLARFPMGNVQIQLALAAGFVKGTYYLTALGTMGVLVVETGEDAIN